MRDSKRTSGASAAAGDHAAPRPPSWLLCGGAVTVLAVTLAGFGGDWHWALDLASHFRRHYLLAAAAGLAIAVVRGADAGTRAALAVALGLNAWTMLPYWLSTPPPAASAVATEPVSLISLNVLRFNQDTAPAIDYLRRRAADVVTVFEVDPAWGRALDSLADVYPHRRIEPRTDSFGLAVLTRWPLAAPRLVDVGGTGYPALVSDVNRPAGRFRIVAVHPYPPVGGANSERLLRYLRATAVTAAESTLPCIVAGDFNATPWSAGFRAFVAGSGLRDTALGRGVQPTWSARLPFGRIPIDHIFAPPDATVVRREIGPDVGSDHFPVEAELILPAP